MPLFEIFYRGRVRATPSNWHTYLELVQDGVLVRVFWLDLRIFIVEEQERPDTSVLGFWKTVAYEEARRLEDEIHYAGSGGSDVQSGGRYVSGERTIEQARSVHKGFGPQDGPIGPKEYLPGDVVHQFTEQAVLQPDAVAQVSEVLNDLFVLLNIVSPARDDAKEFDAAQQMMVFFSSSRRAGVTGTRFTTRIQPDTEHAAKLQHIQAKLSEGLTARGTPAPAPHLELAQVQRTNGPPYSVITLWAPSASEAEARRALEDEGFTLKESA